MARPARPGMLGWLTGEIPIPARFDTPLFAKLAAAPREAL